LYKKYAFFVRARVSTEDRVVSAKPALPNVPDVTAVENKDKGSPFLLAPSALMLITILMSANS
jgi:hypothetical protein